MYKNSSSGKVRLVLTSLEHDHAWWTMDQIFDQPGAELAAVAECHTHLKEKFRHRFGEEIKLFDDFRQMLDEVKPDAAVITAPNNEHLGYLKACAARSVHCFMQKPVSACLADARLMDAVSRSAGIKFMVNVNALWLPTHQEMFRQYKAGLTGPIYKYVSHNGHQGLFGVGVLSEDYIRWMTDPVRNGGGALADQCTYGLHYALWMMGRPLTVYAAVNSIKKSWYTSVEDDALIVLGYKDAAAVMQGSYAWPSFRTEIQAYGPKGGIRIIDDEVVFEEAYSPDEPGKKVTRRIDILPVPPERKNGIAYFIDCLVNDRPLDIEHTAGFNVLVMEVVDAAYKSVSSGNVVKLET